LERAFAFDGKAALSDQAAFDWATGSLPVAERSQRHPFVE
jgi:hypothetical protein